MYTPDLYTATAGQTQFDLTFDYRDRASVRVTVDGANVPFTWVNASRVALVTPATAGQAVKVERRTDTDTPEVTWEDASVVLKEDLNASARQSLDRIQELEVDLGRAVKLPDGLDGQILTPAANQVIAWDSEGEGFTNLDPTDLVAVAGYADARVQVFTGNGSQTAYTISFHPGVLANLDISVGGVTQTAGVDFTWAGTTVTFTEAPPAGATVQIRYARPLAPLPDFDAVLQSVDDAEAAAAAAALSAADAANRADRTLSNLTSPVASRRNLGVEETHIYSLLNELTEAERTDVLTGANSINITAKVRDWITNAAYGSVLDASMLWGSVTFTEDIFAGAFYRPVTFLTGDVTIRMDFNGRSFGLPSNLTWRSLGKTRIRPTVAINSIGSDNSPAAGMIQTAYRRVGPGGSGLAVGTAGNIYADGPGFVPVPGMQVGALIAFMGAVEDPYITHTTSATVSSSATSIPLTGDVTPTIGGSTGYFLIGGTEVVYGNVSGGAIDLTIDNGGRAKQGTSAVEHASGATVVPLLSHVTRLTQVYSVGVVFEDPLPRNISECPYIVGALEPALEGNFYIDGEYDGSAPPANVWNCLSGTLSSGFRAKGSITLRQAPTGGFLLMGARDSDLSIEQIDNCGQPLTHLGGAIWMFGACDRNTVRVTRLVGCEGTCYIDNKSSGHVFFGLNQPNVRNVIEFDHVSGGYYGPDVTAGSDNFIRVRLLDVTDFAAAFYNGLPQQTSAVPTTGNVIIVDRAVDGASYSGNAKTGNFCLINGAVPDQQAILAVELGSTQYVSPHTTLDVNFGPYAVEVGDLLEVFNPTLPSGVTVYAVCTVSGQVTLNFVNAYTGTREIAPQTFTVRRTRP